MAPPARGRRRPPDRRGGASRRRRNGGASRRRGSGDASGVAAFDGRIRLLRFVFIVFLVLVGGKAVALASSSEHLTKIAMQQQQRAVALPAHRGSILDRNGMEMAVGTPQQTVYACPHLLKDPAAATDELCDALQIHRRRQRRDIEKRLSNKKSWFEYVARQVDPSLAKAAVKLGLPGVGAIEEEKRTYPLKGVAAQVLGFAGIDNNGLAGMEVLYDKQLSGIDGSETVVRDTAGRTIKTVRQKEPVAGADVRLTLDSEIQCTAEDVLKKTVRDSGASSATSIVMDPRTGEILAMANVTREGFHGFGKDQATERNRAVTDQYEPGSIFKLVTISGALAEGVVTPDFRIYCPPTLSRYDRTVNESHPRGAMTYSVREILQWSSNVGAVKIGMKMGEQTMYKWMKKFGFGEPTGIDFPGEAAGAVAPVEDWSGVSIVNIPMGQGIAVTAVQMASAFATVANDGIAVKPRLIAQVGTKVYDDAAETRRVIPKNVAREVRSMLKLAVDKGTGTSARIPNYEVAGKTGTAEIALSDGSGYAKNLYVSSFIGMVPADHPRLVVLVAVNGTSMFGSEAAAPAVQKIMRSSLNYLGIAP